MSFLTLRVLLFTAECLAASLLLPLLAFAATRLVHRAALRHLVWLTMFGVLALLPLAALLLPPQVIDLPGSPPMASLAPMAQAPSPEVSISAPMTMVAPVAEARPIFTVENGLVLLVSLWLAGLCWNLARMALGAIGLMRLRRNSALFALQGAACEVRLSPEAGPAAFGIFRPVMLLPDAARRWSAERLQAVLAHEGAHVRRRDAASQALVRLVCAAYWINPLVWLAARALKREAEMAADDAVLSAGMTPSAYAAELLRLAAETRGPVPGIAIAGSALAARLQAVLAENIPRKGVTRIDLARTLSLGLVATLLLGTARIDLALAQDKPANPAPVARPAPAAAPARNTPPKVDIEINRNIERRVEVEAEAIKARADAASAQARARAEAEIDPAKRAQYREEAARVAAAAAATIVRADETRQRTAQVAQKSLEVQQEAMESKQRALEAEQRALESRMKADEARRAHIRRISSTISGVTLETQVMVPVEADLSKETQSRIDAAVVDAMSEARKKIAAAIAEAKAAPVQSGR